MYKKIKLLLIALYTLNASAQFEQVDNIVFHRMDLLGLNRVVLTFQDSILVHEEFKEKFKTIKFYNSEKLDSINVGKDCFFLDGTIGTLADSADKKLVLTSILIEGTEFKIQNKVTYNSAHNIKLYPNYLTFEIGNATYVYKDGKLLHKLTGRIQRIYLDSLNQYYCPFIVKNKILVRCKDKDYSIKINDQKIDYFIDYNTLAYDTSWGTGIVHIDYAKSTYYTIHPGYRIQHGNERTGLYVLTSEKSGLFLYRGTEHCFKYCKDFLGDDEGIYICNGELEGKSEIFNIQVKKSRIEVKSVQKIDYPLSGAIQFKNGKMYSPIIGLPKHKLDLISKYNPYYKSNECEACLGLRSVNKNSYIIFDNRQSGYIKDSNNITYYRPLEVAIFTENPVINGYMNTLGLVILQEYSGSLIAAVERGRLYEGRSFGNHWEYDISGSDIINPCQGKVIGISDSSNLVYFETANNVMVYKVDLYRSYVKNWDFLDSIYIGPNKLIPLNEFEYIGSVDTMNLFYFNPKNGLKYDFGAFTDKNLWSQIKFFKQANNQLLALTHDNILLLFNEDLQVIDSVQLSDPKMRSVTIVGSGKNQEVIFSTISVNEAIEQRLLSKPGKRTEYQITFAQYLNGEVKMWNNRRKTCVAGQNTNDKP